MRGVKRHGAERKPSPRFIGLLQVLVRIGVVACRIALPPSSLGEHGVFHVSDRSKFGVLCSCVWVRMCHMRRNRSKF